jgi:hypothetical protein
MGDKVVFFMLVILGILLLENQVKKPWIVVVLVGDFVHSSKSLIVNILCVFV